MSRQPKPEKPATFESAVAELESIVAGMESGELALEETLKAYKRGAELLRYCQASLQEAQQQVRILEQETLRPFEGAPAESDGQ